MKRRNSIYPESHACVPVSIHSFIHSFNERSAWCEPCIRDRKDNKPYNVDPAQMKTKLETDNCYEGGF